MNDIVNEEFKGDKSTFVRRHKKDSKKKKIKQQNSDERKQSVEKSNKHLEGKSDKIVINS